MKLLVIILLIVGLGQAAEINIVGSSGILAEIKPENCESKLYRWDGEQLHCATIDRLGIMLLQRNHNMRALDTCRKEVTYLRGAALLAMMHNDARAKCREMGKVFDETEVICAGSLTPGEEK